MFNKLFSVAIRLALGVVSLVVITSVQVLILVGIQALFSVVNTSVSTVVFTFLGGVFGVVTVYYVGEATIDGIREFTRKRRSHKAFRKDMTSNNR